MSARLVSLLLLLLAVPVLSQNASIQQQISQRIESREQRISQVAAEPDPAERNAKAARLQAVHHDAEELSALSTSLQSDLQQLGKGFLSKDLDARLKKMEKLSKRLRQEMNR
jgi:Flp pilus assembly protein TadB